MPSPSATERTIWTRSDYWIRLESRSHLPLEALVGSDVNTSITGNDPPFPRVRSR